MIKVKYNIGSKPHEAEFKTESEFVEWIKGNFKFKIFEISGAAEKGIVLKNIDLTGISNNEQFDKVLEELLELLKAFNSMDKSNAIEEFFDTIQAILGFMHKFLGITAQEVMQEYPRHLEKIKNRPRVKEDKHE